MSGAFILVSSPITAVHHFNPVIIWAPWVYLLTRIKSALLSKGSPNLIALRNKFPPRHEILALYATIVFLIYGWAVVTFFWKVPSWLYFLSVGELAAIFSYTLASSLLESTVILIVFLFAGLLLPAPIFADQFTVRGSVIIYILTFWAAIFNLITLIQLPTTNDILSFGLITLLTVTLGLVVTERFPAVQKMLSGLGNRLTVFLYLWLPLSVMGILVILFRIS